MAFKHFIIMLSFGFLISCSGGSGGSTPVPAPVPLPPPIPIGNSNWSIYLSPALSSYDPLSQALWGTDTLNAAFLSAWTSEGFVSNGVFFSGIAPADWSSGIMTLKGTVKSALPTITSYTCYDRNQKDAQNNAVNSNCYTGGTCPMSLCCNIYATQGGLPIAQTCGITLDSNNRATSVVLCTGTTCSGACSIQNNATGPVVDGCFLVGQSGALPNPNPGTPTSGFYCLGWRQKTYDLTKVNLVLNNIFQTPAKPYGCMSPSTVMAGNTAWGALGIGSTCTSLDPSISNVGLAIPNPLYLDPVITYSNPYSDDQLAGIAALSSPTLQMTPQYSIWSQMLTFCTNTNKSFCNSPRGTSRPGVAHVFGRAGPVVMTSYVSLVNKIAPNDYSWQYDDKSALIQCNSATSKAIAYFCGGTQLSPQAASSLFSSPPAGSGSGRFAIVNNCSQDIWAQQKPVPAVLPNIVPKPVNNGTCVPSGSNDLTCDFLVRLAPSAAHVYNTPATGLQSGNIWIKTGCYNGAAPSQGAPDPRGYHCLTGETEDNGSRPNYDVNCPDPSQCIPNTSCTCPTGKHTDPSCGCALNLGPQPDVETKVEFTFGCTAASGCNQTGGSNGAPLGSASYLDITYVDGYTWPVSMQILPGSDENSGSCKSHAAAPLDVSQCPTATDISTRPNG